MNNTITISNKRDPYIDSLKGILIILVVIGHAIQQSNNIIMISISRIIWSFHMPLFILISGYFFKDKQFKDILKESLKYISIYLIITFVLSVSQNGKSLLHTLVYPAYGCWFIISLISWRIITKLLFKYNILLIFAISIIVAVINDYANISTFLSIKRTLCFFPFFLLGLIIKKYNIKLRCSWILVSVFVALSTFFPCFFGFSNNNPILHVRIIHLITSFILSISFFFGVRINNVILQKIGKHTLFIYIAHLPILLFVNYFLYGVWL